HREMQERVVLIVLPDAGAIRDRLDSNSLQLRGRPYSGAQQQRRRMHGARTHTTSEADRITVSPSRLATTPHTRPFSIRRLRTLVLVMILRFGRRRTSGVR